MFKRKSSSWRAAVLCPVLLATAAPVFAQQVEEIIVSGGDAGKKLYHPSRVIVRFANGESPLPDSASIRALGVASLHVVENPPGLSVADVLQRYRNNPNVLYAEPDFEVSTLATPADPLWSQQWDMVKIAAPGAWNLQTSASDVIVAVIDTGVDFNHPDLQGNLWSNPVDGSHGFTCMNGSCTPGGQDDHGHGTHVAGTIGAIAENGVGIAGINWGVQILTCKFLGPGGGGNISDAILCLNQVVELRRQGFNIRVSNNSWGGASYSQALKDAFIAAESVGIVSVCASGNSGANADLTPMYPAALDNRGIISVLASDQNDAASTFTNYGAGNVDIAAPGVSILSTVPAGTCALCDATGYKYLSGTSMAAPHVSGVLAAIFQINPALTAFEARDALLDRASHDPVPDQRASLTSTGGRLNHLKVITNPLLEIPRLNNFPTVTGVSNATAAAGETLTLTATGSDPDGDDIRMAWSKGKALPWLLGAAADSYFPTSAIESISFEAPELSRMLVAPYAVSASDGRGGSAADVAYATILPGSATIQPPSGNLTVSPISGPPGTVVTVNFSATDADGRPAVWDVWRTTAGIASGSCCFGGASTNITFSTAGAYRVTTQAVDRKLNFSNRQSTVVRIGGATGTPPIVDATFDKLSGSVPLTVNINMTASSDPDGSLQSYLVVCDYERLRYGPNGPLSSCVYDKPGVYWMLLQVKDNEGLLDLLTTYVIVSPSGAATAKQPATVTLSNMNRTYTGGPLTPTATTNPPGLLVRWTNAPQINVGSYTVTATIDSPDFAGSAGGTFVITKALATVTLSNLTQTHTGSALIPTAAVTPEGLPIVWTNAPKTAVGTYTVTATVNDANYQGSATGTFTINKAQATVTLSNLTQTYTGSALNPTAETTPAGLAIVWTNAPKTAAGTYNVTATVNDPNYQGSANGTFTINKALATLTLGNLTRTYTGSPLSPSATTTPAGLPVAWTNAPQTNVGSYPVTATVNDANYEGSANGTFTISEAPTQATPPGVTITNPLAGMVRTGAQNIQAAVVAGTNPIAKVEFLVNGSVKCTDTVAPYSCSWNMPGAVNRTYELRAKAYDSTGLAGLSPPVSVISSR